MKEGKKKINLKARTHAHTNRPIKNKNKVNSHKTKTSKTNKQRRESKK